jgi:hypothetical protein
MTAREKAGVTGREKVRESLSGWQTVSCGVPVTEFCPLCFSSKSFEERILEASPDAAVQVKLRLLSSGLAFRN